MMDSLPSVNASEKSPVFSSVFSTSHLLKNNPATQDVPPQDPYTFPSSPLPGKFNKHDKRSKTRLWRYMFMQDPQREPPQELFNQDGHISTESEKLDAPEPYASDKERVAKIMNKDFNHNQKLDGVEPQTEQQKKDHFEFSEDENPPNDVLSKKKQRGSKNVDRPQSEDGLNQPTCSSESVNDNIFDYINNVSNPPPLLSIMENPASDISAAAFGKKKPGKQAKLREKPSRNMVEQENGETSIKICDVYTDDMFNFLDEIPTVPVEGKHSDSTETYISDLVDTPPKSGTSRPSKEDIVPGPNKRKEPDDSETDSAPGDSPSKKRRGRPPKGKPGRKPRQKRGEPKLDSPAMPKSPRAKAAWNYHQKVADQSSSSSPSLQSDASQPPSPSSVPGSGEPAMLENHVMSSLADEAAGNNPLSMAAPYPSQIEKVPVPAKRGPGRPPKMPSLTPVKIQQATSTQLNGISSPPAISQDLPGNAVGEAPEMHWEPDANPAADPETSTLNKPGRKKGQTPRKKTPRKTPAKKAGRASPASKKTPNNIPQSDRFSPCREQSPPKTPEPTKRQATEIRQTDDENQAVDGADQSTTVKQNTADSSLANIASDTEHCTPVKEIPVTSSTTKKKRRKRASSVKDVVEYPETSNPETDNVSVAEGTPAKVPGSAKKGKKSAKNSCLDLPKDEEDNVSLDKIGIPQSPLLSPEVPYTMPGGEGLEGLVPEDAAEVATTSKGGASKLEEKLPIKKRKKKSRRSALTMPRRINKMRAPVSRVNKQVSAADSTSVLPKGRKKRTKKIPEEAAKVTRNAQKRTMEAMDAEAYEEKAAVLRNPEPSPIKMALRPQSSPVKFDFNVFEDSEDYDDDIMNEDADPSYTARDNVDVSQSTGLSETKQRAQSPQKRRGPNKSRTSRRSLSFNSQDPAAENAEEQPPSQEMELSVTPPPTPGIASSGTASSSGTGSSGAGSSGTASTGTATSGQVPTVEACPTPTPIVQHVLEHQDNLTSFYKTEISQLKNLLRESDMVIGYLIRLLAECGKTIPPDIKDQLCWMLAPSPVPAPPPTQPVALHPCAGQDCIHRQQRNV